MLTVHSKKMKSYEFVELGNGENDENSAWRERLKAVQSTIQSDGQRIFKIAWNMTGLLFIALLQFMLFPRAIFAGTGNGSNRVRILFVIDVVAQIYFCIDLYVQWHMDWFKKSEKKRKSQRRWQWIDYFITIPWPFLGLLGSPKLYYYFRCVDIIRAIRIRHYWNDMRKEIVHYTGSIISIHAGFAAVIYHVYVLFLLASYFSCGWYLVGSAPGGQWVDNEDKPVFANSDGDDDNIASTHVLAMYWAIVTMSSVGYGGLFCSVLFCLV